MFFEIDIPLLIPDRRPNILNSQRVVVSLHQMVRIHLLHEVAFDVVDAVRRLNLHRLSEHQCIDDSDLDLIKSLLTVLE